jgi:hypothetical protein
LRQENPRPSLGDEVAQKEISWATAGLNAQQGFSSGVVANTQAARIIGSTQPGFLSVTIHKARQSGGIVDHDPYDSVRFHLILSSR